MSLTSFFFFFFFFNDPATTEIYTLSLHDALPILRRRCTRFTSSRARPSWIRSSVSRGSTAATYGPSDRKSTRLNSSHLVISYAVFCLKKKNKKQTSTHNHYTEHPSNRTTQRPSCT